MRPWNAGQPLYSEWLLMCGASVAVAYLGLVAAWAPGAKASLFVFGCISIGQWFLIRLRTVLDSAWVRKVSYFWAMPALVLGHGAIAPIAESAHVALWDRHLAQMDLFLFGAYPAVWFERWAPPVLNEFFFVCYYSYYFWPAVFAIWAYSRSELRVFEQFRLAITACFILNFVLYAVVPAVGPRFFLHHEFTAPLKGLWLTSWLESLMFEPAFMRDCFPSGHTAITLIVLVHAFRRNRIFFILMLPFAAGLLVATVAGRFHYVVDLIAAVPLAWLACRLADLNESTSHQQI